MVNAYPWLSDKATRSVHELLQENARLKDLVVHLSALVLKNIVHESKSTIHDLASRDRIFPRSKAEEDEIAEALEVAGHALIGQAVEMKLISRGDKLSETH